MYRLGFFASVIFAAHALAFAPIDSRAAESYKISGPHNHENLSIYFVHGQSAPGPVPLTLAEALANKTVEVIETGSVRRLEIENRGNREVFLQMGDIVKGGRQDRVLARSLLLPPQSGRVNIGAYCVESGRWARRGREDALRFASALRMLPSRDAKLALATPPNADLADSGRVARIGVPPGGGQVQADQRGAGSDALRWAEAEASRRAEALASPSADQQRITDQAIARRGSARQRRATRSGRSRQGEIWSRVAETQGKLSRALNAQIAASQSPSSLQLALENKVLNKKIDSYVGALMAKADSGDDIIGYVFAVNGWINSGDVYPSGGLFKKMWPKLLKAAATEAIGETTKKADAPPPVETVSAFLKDAEMGKIQQLRMFEDVELETRSTSRVLFNVSRRRARRARSAKPGTAPVFDAVFGTAVHRNYIARR